MSVSNTRGSVGELAVSYLVTVSGFFSLGVSVSDIHISGSPFFVRVQSAPVSVKETLVAGIPPIATAMSPLPLLISAKDAYGNAQPSNFSFSFLLSPIDSFRQSVISFSSTQPKTVGSFAVNVFSSQTGNYFLSVLLHGTKFSPSVSTPAFFSVGPASASSKSVVATSYAGIVAGITSNVHLNISDNAGNSFAHTSIDFVSMFFRRTTAQTGSLFTCAAVPPTHFSCPVTLTIGGTYQVRVNTGEKDI